VIIKSNMCVSWFSDINFTKNIIQTWHNFAKLLHHEEGANFYASQCTQSGNDVTDLLV